MWLGDGSGGRISNTTVTSTSVPPTSSSSRPLARASSRSYFLVFLELIGWCICAQRDSDACSPLIWRLSTTADGILQLVSLRGNICVLKMDHHCIWVVNCVGARNYKYFHLSG